MCGKYGQSIAAAGLSRSWDQDGIIGRSWVTGDSCPGGCDSGILFVCDEVRVGWDLEESIEVRGVLVCERCGWFDDMAAIGLNQVPYPVLLDVLRGVRS